MTKHVKLYLDYFGYGIEDFIPCEVCGQRAVDIHHIEARGMGGTGKADVIENLQALCRACHVEFGDKKRHKEFLMLKHKEKLNDNITRTDRRTNIKKG